MEQQRNSGNFAQPVRVEPHTEVGRIAVRYNGVLGKMNSQTRDLRSAASDLEASNRSLTTAIETRNMLEEKASDREPLQVGIPGQNVP
ncbi:MAG: hypothetical protein GY725_18970 [bacterium]|nr:hypothetical protein [bacterium]